MKASRKGIEIEKLRKSWKLIKKPLQCFFEDKLKYNMLKDIILK